MKIFLGIVVNSKNGEIVHSHISESPDDTFQVEIWGEDGNKPVIEGEFRKWHHLENIIKAKELVLNFYLISIFKDVTTTEMINFLTDKKDANIF